MGLNIYILTYKQKEKYSGMEWLKGKLVFLYIGFKQWECQGLVLIHMGRAETKLGSSEAWDLGFLLLAKSADGWFYWDSSGV